MINKSVNFSIMLYDSIVKVFKRENHTPLQYKVRFTSICTTPVGKDCTNAQSNVLQNVDYHKNFM